MRVRQKSESISILRVSGTLLMIGVALSMATCLYNDRRASLAGAPSLV